MADFCRIVLTFKPLIPCTKSLISFPPLVSHRLWRGDAFFSAENVVCESRRSVNQCKYLNQLKVVEIKPKDHCKTYKAETTCISILFKHNFSASQTTPLFSDSNKGGGRGRGVVRGEVSQPC